MIIFTKETIIQCAQGNPGALRVCINLATMGRIDVVGKMLTLGICGCRVWLAFKDLGDQTLTTLIENVESQDLCARLAAMGYACEVSQ